MTEDNRVMYYCPKCQKSWLIERNRPEWKGTSAQQLDYSQHVGRYWQVCYCGTPIRYPSDVKEASA